MLPFDCLPHWGRAGGNSHCYLTELPEDVKKKKGSSEPFFKTWYPTK